MIVLITNLKSIGPMKFTSFLEWNLPIYLPYMGVYSDFRVVVQREDNLYCVYKLCFSPFWMRKLFLINIFLIEYDGIKE